MDAYMRCDVSVCTFERLEVTGRSCSPFRSRTEVIDSAVEGGRSNFFNTTLNTENIHSQVLAFILKSQTGSHAVLLFIANVGDTSSLVELAASEDGLPSLVEVVGIEFIDRAVGCAGSTANEETSVLREAEVLEVELIVVEELERCLLCNAKTAVVSTNGLEGCIECEEGTGCAGGEHALAVLRGTTLGNKHLTEALAGGIVINNQAVGRVELVALANLEEVE